MADPNLILGKTDLEGEVGSYLGWGRGPDNGEEEWDAQKVRDIASILRTAQNRFYTLAQLRPPDGPVHSWTFLTPSVSVTLGSGERTARLPEDFGYLYGEIAVRAGATSGYWPIKLDNIDRVRMLFSSNDDQSGRPRVAAIDELRGVGATRSSRGELLVYPEADADYTLEFSYSVIPSLISDRTPFPYGGAAHAETFKAACLAAAELYLDYRNADGPMNQNYRVCLAASIAYDRKRKPQTMSYNGDRSDGLDADYGGRYDRNYLGHLSIPTITLGGLDPI